MAAILNVVWTVLEHCVFVCVLWLASGTFQCAANHLHQSPSLFPVSFFNLIISNPPPPTHTPHLPFIIPSVSCRDSLMYIYMQKNKGGRRESKREIKREMRIIQDEVAPPFLNTPPLVILPGSFEYINTP